MSEHMESALKAAFSVEPLSKMISDQVVSLSGNSNGKTFAEGTSGSPICLDDSGFWLQKGTRMLEAVMGQCAPAQPIKEMDVSVNDVEYCLSMIGPPASDGPSWTVALRRTVGSNAHRPIAVAVHI